jgi:hypothetical protein
MWHPCGIVPRYPRQVKAKTPILRFTGVTIDLGSEEMV